MVSADASLRVTYVSGFRRNDGFGVFVTVYETINTEY